MVVTNENVFVGEGRVGPDYTRFLRKHADSLTGIFFVFYNLLYLAEYARVLAFGGIYQFGAADLIYAFRGEFSNDEFPFFVEQPMPVAVANNMHGRPPVSRDDGQIFPVTIAVRGIQAAELPQ